MSLQIPLDVLAKLWPHAAPALRSGIASTSAAVLPKYGIATLLDLTDFLAQVSEETNGGLALIENLNYSAERLMVVWHSRFPTLAAAQAVAHNPQALAEAVYGTRGGNVAGSGDGWSYRGRGLIQLTFRDNYKKSAEATGLDLLNHPEILIDPLHALECACAYWQYAGISVIANSGDFTRETIKINGGTTNMAARLAWKQLWTGALNADNTKPAPADPPASAAGGGGGSDPAAGATTGQNQMTFNPTLDGLLKFIQDLPTATIGQAVAAGGTNIPLDIAAGKGIMDAILKDFFSGATASLSAAPATAAAAAPHTAAAIQAHVDSTS